MEKLEAICGGWREVDLTHRKGLIASADPLGGIIDVNAAGLGWFIIFNDDRIDETWYPTRDAAIEAFCNFSVDTKPESV